MKIEKIKTYLGFAIKSGEIVFGYDKLIVCKKQPGIVIVCSTQNEKVTEKVHRYCINNGVEYIKLQNMILGDLIGRENCKVVGVLNRNLATAIKNELKSGNLE